MVLVKSIVTEHHTWRLKKIKQWLEEDYGVSLSDTTLKSYKKELQEIDRRHSREKRETEKLQIQQEKKTVTAVAKKKQFPYIIKDPAGKPHTVQSENCGFSIPWRHGDGLMTTLEWSHRNPVWTWRDSGVEYGKKAKRRTAAGFARLTHEND